MEVDSKVYTKPQREGTVIDEDTSLLPTTLPSKDEWWGSVTADPRRPMGANTQYTCVAVTHPFHAYNDRL